MDRKKAIGVEFDRYGTKSSFKANKEVILSSGAVNSPAILMHSGIGEANLLKKFDINVNHNLPGVGKNLQDHLGVYVQHECLQPVTMYKWFRPDRAVTMMINALLFMIFAER